MKLKYLEEPVPEYIHSADLEQAQWSHQLTTANSSTLWSTSGVEHLVKHLVEYLVEHQQCGAPCEAQALGGAGASVYLLS